MKINFNWKYSKHEMPKENDNIIVCVDKELIDGQIIFTNWSIQIKGHILNSSLNKESSCVSVLSGKDFCRDFFWDYQKPEFKYPNKEKIIRKNKLKKIQDVENI